MRIRKHKRSSLENDRTAKPGFMRQLFLLVFLIPGLTSFSQNGWSVCNAPAFTRRVDDIFMVNTQVGYAASGDGMIVKTMDGGNNWSLIKQESNTYFRSVEFLNEQIGFIGAFPSPQSSSISILRKTIDGGASWIDLTPQLPEKAKPGICGLAIADANTIYGCGNWYQDSGYIIKSIDGGATWDLIDMGAFSTSIIDLHFINKDTGFATGKGKLPLATGIILYTTDGGQNWTYKYSGNTASEYCWKIQRLTSEIYFASIQDNLTSVSPKILRSNDGGMTWVQRQVALNTYNIEGIGFIDPLHGWTGGALNNSFETFNGGLTWQSTSICPLMNRVQRLNDSTMFATGTQIWKYTRPGLITSVPALPMPATRFVSLKCHPNPVKDILKIDIAITVSTHVSLLLLDASGRRVKVIDNTDRVKGSYKFNINTADLPAGTYYVSLMTHEDKMAQPIIVSR